MITITISIEGRSSSIPYVNTNRESNNRKVKLKTTSQLDESLAFKMLGHLRGDIDKFYLIKHTGALDKS